MKNRYLNLSNKLYDYCVPDLEYYNDPNVETLRIVGRYIFDIGPLADYVNLSKLNISFTYVTNLVNMPSLTELQMVEVGLIDYNDLALLPKLVKLKLSNDNMNLTKPLVNVKILSVAVLYNPHKLHILFPNLEEIRFEHIHPLLVENRQTDLIPTAKKFYKNLTYSLSKSTKTIMQLADSDFIDDFDDETYSIDFGKYSDNFGLGLIKTVNIKFRYKSYSLLCVYNSIGKLMTTFDKPYLINQNPNSLIKLNSYKRKEAQLKILFDLTCGKSRGFPLCRLILDRIIFNNYKLSGDDKKMLLKEDFEICRKEINTSKKDSPDISSIDYFKEEWSPIFLLNSIKQDMSRDNRISEENIRKIKFMALHQNMGYYFNNNVGQKLKEKGILLDSNMVSGMDFYKKGEKPPEHIDDIKDQVYFNGSLVELTKKEKGIILELLKGCTDTGFLSYYKKAVGISNNNGDAESSLEIDGMKLNDSGATPIQPMVCVKDPIVSKTYVNLGIVGQLDSIIKEQHLPECCECECNNSNSNSEDNSDDSDDNTDNADNTKKNNNDSNEVTNSDVFEELSPGSTKISRFHLYLYGRAANLSKPLVNSCNSCVFLCQTGDVGDENSINVLFDKDKHIKLFLEEIVFIFKNKPYMTDYENGSIVKYDMDKDFVIRETGLAYAGNGWWPSDCIIEPHPDLMCNRDIIINSPILGSYAETMCCKKAR